MAESSKGPRALIFGSGNLGIVFGMILDRAKADITSVCRSNFEAANSQGFAVHSTVLGDHTYRPKVVRTVSDGIRSEDAPFDFVLVCTKALPGTNPSPASLIAPAIRIGHTAIVIVQNGIGMEQEYASYFPQNPIISGVAYMPTSQISPGKVSQTETQRLLIGSYPAKDIPKQHLEKMSAFAEIMRSGGASVSVQEDIQVERWKKLIGNTTWNTITALSRCRDLEFLQSNDLSLDFVKAVMKEVVSVATAAGYGKEIDETAVDVQLKRSEARSWPGVEPSTMADMQNGRRMEVEVIVGKVVKLAKASGVQVPRLETLYLLLSGLDWSLQDRNRSANQQ